MHNSTDRVLLLCVPGVQLIDVAGPLDVFDTTNRVLRRAAYETVLRSVDGGDIAAGNGLGLSTSKLTRNERVDTLIIPGSFTNAADLVDDAFAAAVVELAARADRLVSICNGAFALAHAGLLDGRRATTHWAMCAELAETYPEVDVDADAFYAQDGPVTTSGGASSGADLAIALVAQDHGPKVAGEVARWLVMYRHRPGGQAQFINGGPTRVETENPAVQQALDAILEDVSADHRVATLADRVGLSRRHFARLFRAETGTTVARHVDSVRLQRAIDLLETTSVDLETVARRSGYSSSELLRQVFQRERGITPGEHRRRFGAARV